MTGAELRRRRVALGLTQAELAEVVGFAPNTIARWERDELRIAPGRGRALDRYLTSLERKEPTTA